MFEKTAKKTDKRFVKFVKGSHNISETKRATGYLLVTKYLDTFHILNFSNKKTKYYNCQQINFFIQLSLVICVGHMACTSEGREGRSKRSWGSEGPRLLVINNSSQVTIQTGG